MIEQGQPAPAGLEGGPIRIPFLRPRLASHGEYAAYLAEMEDRRIYGNYGPLNSRFEARLLHEHFGGEGALTTVANATLGLMLALAHARRPGGRYALMPSFTFAATVHAALWCGLEPYFVDVRPGDWCLDEVRLVEACERLGDQVAAVVPYAAFGTAMDLAPYGALVARGFPVVVDAAASFGATFEGRQFGRGFPGLVVYSFHATKTFPIGEGGLVHGADTAAIAAVRRAANFGFDEGREAQDTGLNAKLSELAAAVGLATLDTFGARVEGRLALLARYQEELAAAGLLAAGFALQQVRGQVPPQFMSVLCPPGHQNGRYVAALAERGIQARTYFSPPCHRHPRFASCPSAGLAVTDDIAARVLSLPFWEEMGAPEVSEVVSGLACAR